MIKKLLLIIMTASVLLLSCSNKNTTGVGYKDNSASSSNEANTSEINTEINDKVELDDNGILGILAKEMKTRQDSLTEFEKAGREDLIAHVKE